VRCEGAARRDLQSARWYKNAVEKAAVVLRMETEMLMEAGPRHGNGRRDRERSLPAELCAKALEAPGRQQVLDAGLLAIPTVPVIAQERGDRSNGPDGVLGPDKADKLREHGHRVGPGRSYALSPAGKDVKADDFSVAHDGDESTVV